MKTACFVLLFVISCVFGDTGTVETKSVKEGNMVTLNSDVTKGPNDAVLWYFNNTRIALINGDPRKSCVYDGEGEQFKDRLEVDYKTGSLIVTNITAEHAGSYEAELIRNQTTGNQQSLNRNPKCDGKKNIKKMSNFGKTIKILIVSLSDPDDTNEEPYKVEKQDSGKVTESTTAGPTRDATTTASVGVNESEKRSEGSGLSPGAVAGIVVGVGVVLLVAVGGVKIYRCRRSRNEAVL